MKKITRKLIRNVFLLFYFDSRPGTVFPWHFHLINEFMCVRINEYVLSPNGTCMCAFNFMLFYLLLSTSTYKPLCARISELNIPTGSTLVRTHIEGYIFCYFWGIRLLYVLTTSIKTTHSVFNGTQWFSISMDGFYAVCECVRYSKTWHGAIMSNIIYE